MGFLFGYWLGSSEGGRNNGEGGVIPITLASAFFVLLFPAQLGAYSFIG